MRSRGEEELSNLMKGKGEGGVLSCFHGFVQCVLGEKVNNGRKGNLVVP